MITLLPFSFKFIHGIEFVWYHKRLLEYRWRKMAYSLQKIKRTQFSVMSSIESSWPPMKGLLLPDMYTRLDAAAIERTRVLNQQLDVRLRLQERTMVKRRLDVVNCYLKDAKFLIRDLRHIRRKLPNFCGLPPIAYKSNNGTRDITQSHEDAALCGRYYVHHIKRLPNIKRCIEVYKPTKKAWSCMNILRIDWYCRWFM